jgi:hypothetical protein
VIVALAIIITLFIVGTSLVVLLANSPSPNEPAYPAHYERISILNTSLDTDVNSLLLTCKLVHGVNGTNSSTLNQAIIKNTEGVTVGTIPLQTELNLNQETPLRINLNNYLISGNYTLVLITVEGGNFVSTFSVK